MDVKIRPGLLFDIPVIASYQIAMALETEKMKLDADVVDKGVSAVFDDPSKGKYWVAEVNGNVIGCLLTIPEWSDWRNGTVLWVHSVYVHPDFRKNGVYRKLYSHLKAMVENSSEYRGIRLYVDKSNNRAQDVYKALGMSCEHYHLYEWMKP